MSGLLTNEMLHNEAVKPLETELKQLQRECAGLELSGDDDDTRMRLASIQESILLKRFEIALIRLTTGQGSSRSAADLSKAAAMLTELDGELASCDDKPFEQFLSAKKEDLAQKQAAVEKNSAAASKQAADPGNGFGKGNAQGKGTKLDSSADKDGPAWTNPENPPNEIRFHFAKRAAVQDPSKSRPKARLWCHKCQKWFVSDERRLHQLRDWPHGAGKKASATRESMKLDSFFPKTKGS